MATDLGKVGMRMRGDWSSSATYEVLDAVSYSGGLYVAKQAVPANTAPTNTTYWQAAIYPKGAAVDISSAFTLPDDSALATSSVQAFLYGNLVEFSIGGTFKEANSIQNKLLYSIDSNYKPNITRTIIGMVTMNYTAGTSETKALPIVLDGTYSRIRTPNQGGFAFAVTAMTQFTISGSYYI